MFRYASILGICIIALSFVIPAYWFWQIALNGYAVAMLSQYLGVAALIAMAYVQLFATRWHWLEWIFGPLDKLYVQHKWLGIGALAMVFLHDQIDAEAGDNPLNGGWLARFFANIAEDLGGFGFDMLQVLLLITVILMIPYHWWRWTHKLIGIAFALSAVHFAFIEKPYTNAHPLSIYTLSFCALGVFCYIYTLLPEKWLLRFRSYTVTKVEQSGGSTVVTLSPNKRGFAYRAGQFAFVKFDHPKLKEVHPFTISQAMDSSRQLRFSMKELGDYTQRLPGLIEEGMKARVQGAFGHFSLKPSKPQAWIAAGIGITPFVAWAQHRLQQAEQFPDKVRKPVHWFYCIRNESEAPHLEEVKALAEELPEVQLHIMDSSAGQRLQADAVIEALGQGWPKVQIGFCGPQKMRESLQKAFKAKGLPDRYFHFEEFEIRSGIGLDRLILWVWKYIQQKLGHYWQQRA